MASSSSSDDGNPFNAAAPVSISAATTQLINIKSHVPVTLGVGDSNFTIWRTFFNIVFRKFGPVDHVDGTIDSHVMIFDAEWTQIDTTLSADLLSAVVQPNDDAYTAWTTIATQFLDNIVQRTVQLRQQLHALCQGDLAVAEYCGRLKDIADKLRVVGSPLTD